MIYLYFGNEVNFICKICALKYAKKKTVSESAVHISGHCDICGYAHTVTDIKNYNGLDTSAEGITLKKNEQ